MAEKRGLSVEDAIPVNSVCEEYVYLDAKYGKRGKGWRLVGQYLIGTDDKPCDKLEIRLASGEVKELYFDISAFHHRPKMD